MSDLRIKANKDFSLKLVYKDMDGFVVDITGATARLMARRSLSSNALIDITAIIDGPAGEIVFPFKPEDTADILTTQEEEILQFDVDLIHDGKTLPILQDGRIFLRKSAVRD